MGRKKTAKTGGSAILYSKVGADGDKSASRGEVDEEEDFLHFEENKRSNESDNEGEEDDEEVFDLAQDGSSDSESDEDSESESESDSGSSDEDSDKTNSKGRSEAAEDTENLKSLVENLPANLRQKVLLGKTDFLSDDEDSSDEEEEGGGDSQGFSGVSWGKKKSYYTGDTADLEIGQDMEDAIDEEEAALSLQKQRLQGMRESDFTGDDDMGWEKDDDDDEDDADMSGSLSKKDKKGEKKKSRNSKSTFIESLESVALEENTMDISDISRDIKKMTKRQRLEMLASELPELIGLSRELLSFSNIIFSDLTKLRTFLASSNYGSTPSEELFVHYLDAKMSLYHSYSTNVMFAMYLRAAGKNLRAHPVMKQLLEHQYAIRNLAKVDKFYRDECMSLHSIRVSSEGASADEINRLLDRHRGSGTEGDSSEDDGGAGNDEDEDGESNEEMGVMGSDDDESETDDADLLEEEEAFNRLDGARGIKRKRVSGRSRVPASADFGEFEEADDKLGLDVSKSRAGAPSLKSSLQGFLQAQNKTVKSAHGLDDQLGELGRPVKARNDAKDDSSDDSEDDGDALDDDDEESGRAPPLEGGIEALRALLRGEDPARGGKRERRKAPDESMYGDGEETSYGNEGVGSDDGNDDDNDDVDDDGDNNLYEAFAGAKQRYMAKKKLHYTPAPRYGGVEQTVEEGGKRGASYEIIKNKGLTPHRKKANRNPRVKKRQMYAKAVIARKGQVREVVTPGAAYGGEATGIKANLSKGRKIKT